MAASSRSENAFDWVTLRLRLGAHVAVDELLQRLDGEVLLVDVPHFGEELVRQDRDVRAFQPGRLHDVHDLGRDDGAADDLLDRQLPLGGALLAVAGHALDQRGADRLEEADLVADFAGLIARRRQRERLRERHHGVGIAPMRALLAFLGRLLGGIAPAAASAPSRWPRP